MNGLKLFATLFAVQSVSMPLSGKTVLSQTVQLPSQEIFSYSGSVWVPDGGSTFLGGVKSARTSSGSRGFSRGYDSSMGNSQAVASVTIIDLEEMDRQILGGTPAEFIRRELSTETRSGQSLASNDRDADGKAWVRHARKSYQQGNHSIAFSSYQTAINLLSPNLRTYAINEFKRVFGPAAEQSIAVAVSRE